MYFFALYEVAFHDLEGDRVFGTSLSSYGQRFRPLVVLSRDGKSTTQPVSLVSGYRGLTRLPEPESRVSCDESKQDLRLTGTETYSVHDSHSEVD